MSNGEGFDFFESRESALNDPETAAVRKLSDEIVPRVRQGAETEEIRYKVIVDEIRDLMEECHFSGSLSVGAMLEKLSDDYEVHVLTTRWGAASLFHERPERVRRFVQEMGAFVGERRIDLDMPLTEALDALEREHEGNKKIIEYAGELDRGRGEREKFDQLIDMCTRIERASADTEKTVRVERAPDYQGHDRLILRLTMKEIWKAMDFTEVLGKIPRSSVERNGRQILFSAPFKKSFLDAARESFPWIPGSR
jgi:hypothetical protein